MLVFKKSKSWSCQGCVGTLTSTVYIINGAMHWNSIKT